MPTVIPDFQDEVTHIISGVTGIVDAKYIKDGVSYLDVQVNYRMYYGTPTSNWKVVNKYIE